MTMKNKIILFVLVLAAFAAGVWLGPRFSGAPGDGAVSSESASGEREILYWVAPMDPNFKRDEPGKSPMGMDLVPVYADEVGGDCEIILDGGVRRGTHVLKALARGATACAMGRPYLWGLAAGGEAGVTRALNLLREEIRLNLGLLGCRTVADVGEKHLSTPGC